MDPLTLLRDFNLKNQLSEVKVVGDQVQFGSQYVFPKTSFTAFKSLRDYETLEVVLHVLQTRALNQPEYLKAAEAQGLGRLSFVDRKASAFLQPQMLQQLQNSMKRLICVCRNC